MTTLLLFTIIMYLSMTISGVIGFAGNVIALPLLSLILDLPSAVSFKQSYNLCKTECIFTGRKA